MKYHVKSLGMTKTQDFCQDLYEYDLLSMTHKDYVSTLTV